MIAAIVLGGMLISFLSGMLVGGVIVLERRRGPRLQIATDAERRARLGLKP